MALPGPRLPRERMEKPSVTGKSQRNIRVLIVLAALGPIAVVGCGATQLKPNNRHLLEALQTAVTSKNAEWLTAVEKHVQEAHDKATLSDAEFKTLGTVIDSAKTGDWKTAERRVFALSEGQRPTAEEQARVRERRTSTK